MSVLQKPRTISCSKIGGIIKIAVDVQALRDRQTRRALEPLLDVPGQPTFRELKRYPKIASLMREPDRSMTLQVRIAGSIVMEKSVTVWKNGEQYAKYGWRAGQGCWFRYIN